MIAARHQRRRDGAGRHRPRRAGGAAPLWRGAAAVISALVVVCTGTGEPASTAARGATGGFLFHQLFSDFLLFFVFFLQLIFFILLPNLNLF